MEEKLKFESLAVIDNAKTEEKNEEDSEKEREKNFNQEFAKAERVAVYIKKINGALKYCKWLFICLSLLFGGIAVYKTVNYVSRSSKTAQEIFELLLRTNQINKSIRACLVLCIVFAILPSIMNRFKTLIFSGYINKKIEQEGFDYKKFYSNFPTDDDGEPLPPILLLGENLLDQTDINLTEYIRYKTDTASMLKQIIRKIVFLGIFVFCSIALYNLAISNIEQLMLYANLGQLEKFEPQDMVKVLASLGIAGAMLLESFIDSDMEDAYNWVKKIYKEGFYYKIYQMYDFIQEGLLILNKVIYSYSLEFSYNIF